MKSHIIAALVAASTVSGCALFQPQPLANGRDTKLVEATPVPPPIVESIDFPSVTPPPGQSRSLLRKPPVVEDPQQATKSANAKATQTPKGAQFVEAMMIYDYIPGGLYKVIAAPLRVTTIALRPGEVLTKQPAAGDTLRWKIADAVSGSKPNEQQLIYIKPLKGDLKTNMVVTTNERVYFIDLESNEGDAYNAGVAWNYPMLEMQQIQQDASRAAKVEANTIAAAVDPTALNNDYEITTTQGSTPPWRPVRVSDDGKKTWIEFPPGLGNIEAPALFVLTNNDELALVNVRIKGRYYILDNTIGAAELRAGTDPQTIVRITNKRPASAAGGSRAFTTSNLSTSVLQ